VRGLTRRDKGVQDVSFDLRRGEILGLAGLMGAGRTEVLEGIFGYGKIDAGTITINGKVVKIAQPKDAIAAGIGLLTEDRKRTGIMGVLSVKDNMSVASMGRFTRFGFLQGRRIDKEVQRQREALAIKTPSIAQLIKLLSGGNQQKVLVSRWLMTSPDILMIDEPTRGIDVGAKAEIHRLMSQLAQQGKGILMVSSELPEILGMSDRVLVMHEGRITGEFSREEATQERIMAAATNTSAAA
jgi:inositol transport system ATP-binding protein